MILYSEDGTKVICVKTKSPKWNSSKNSWDRISVTIDESEINFYFSVRNNGSFFYFLMGEDYYKTDIVAASGLDLWHYLHEEGKTLSRNAPDENKTENPVFKYNKEFVPKMDSAVTFIAGIDHAISKMEHSEEAVKQFSCLGWSNEMKEFILNALDSYQKSELQKIKEQKRRKKDGI